MFLLMYGLPQMFFPLGNKNIFFKCNHLGLIQYIHKTILKFLVGIKTAGNIFPILSFFLSKKIFPPFWLKYF